jgi:hypothetical protein
MRTKNIICAYEPCHQSAQLIVGKLEKACVTPDDERLNMLQQVLMDIVRTDLAV